LLDDTGVETGAPEDAALELADDTGVETGAPEDAALELADDTGVVTGAEEAPVEFDEAEDGAADTVELEYDDTARL
jgi:hypothetical protein